MPTYFDGSGSSSGSGTGLSPVAVNGASHTAASGELCQCNYTSTGAVAIQLPLGTVGVVDSGGAALSGSHPITVTAPAGYTFLSGGGSTFVIGLGATLSEFAADDCSATFVTNSTTMKVEVSAGLLVLGTMASQNAGAVAITGGTATGLTKLGVRDTSAAYDAVVAATSSTPLSAERTLTVDLVNGSRTLKVSGNAEVSGTNTGGNTGDQTVTGLGLDALAPGAALTNANVSIAPGTDKASEYTLPAATLTGAHTCTLATTGSPTTGLTVWIVRRDLTANTYAVINGGAGAGTLVTLPASPGKPMGACVYFDGTNWSLTAVVYLVA